MQLRPISLLLCAVWAAAPVVIKPAVQPVPQPLQPASAPQAVQPAPVPQVVQPVPVAPVTNAPAAAPAASQVPPTAAPVVAPGAPATVAAPQPAVPGGNSPVTAVLANPGSGLSDQVIEAEVAKVKAGSPANTLLDWIRTRKVNPSWRNGELYSAAVEAGIRELVGLLLIKRVPVPPAILPRAIVLKRYEIVRSLLASDGVDLHADEDKALEMVLLTCQGRMLQLFLDHPKVDPMMYDGILMHFAIRTECLKGVELLLKDGRMPPNHVMMGKPLVEHAKEVGNRAIIQAIEKALTARASPTTTINGPAPAPGAIPQPPVAAAVPPTVSLPLPKI